MKPGILNSQEVKRDSLDYGFDQLLNMLRKLKNHCPVDGA